MRKLLILVSAMALLPTPALPCGGTPPPPTCAKSLTIAKGIRRTLVNSSTTPVTVRVPVGAFLQMSPPPGTPGSSCPATPGPVTITVTATCTAGPVVTGTSTTAVAAGTWTRTVVPVTFPPGRARRCTIQAQASSTCVLTTGTPLTATATGDVDVCLVDPVPGTNLPRLGVALVHEDGTEYTDMEVLEAAHPGASLLRWYRITNNDPTLSVDVDLQGMSNQTAIYPDPTGEVFNADGSGLFAISDPGRADDFPIAWSEDVACDGCLALPDPAGSVSPIVQRTARLRPGDSMTVAMTSRAWGMCADGSCSEQGFVVTGTYANGDVVDACAQASHMLDVTEPPAYGWPDAGAAGMELPAGPDVVTVVQPAPQWADELTTRILNVQGTVGGLPLLRASTVAEPIGLDWIRLHTELVTPLPLQPGQPVHLFLQQEARAGNGQLVLRSHAAMPGSPPGYEDRFPYGMGMMMLTNAAGNTAPIELFEQISAWAELRSGSITPMSLQWVPMPMGGGAWGAEITATAPLVGPGDLIVAIHLMSDQRHFAHSAAPVTCLDPARLQVNQLVPGRKMHFYTEGFEPGVPVYLLYSTAGPGRTCHPAFPTACVDLAAPTLLTTLTPGPLGTGQINLVVPPTVPLGLTLSVQALQITPTGSETSNRVTRITGP
jgi:hypothetical protein